MKIKLIDGMHYASYKDENGKVYMGYSEKLGEAMLFCAELVIARDEK